LFDLRPAILETQGLIPALQNYVERFPTNEPPLVHFQFAELPMRLPQATETAIFDVVQEAITNARKHAGAANLWVTCAIDPPYAQIEISDDGRGIDRGRPDGHYGLAIMTERAERIRGRLEIRPRHPRGTTVAVVLGTPSRRDSVRDSVSAPEGE
jgi:signal transduction histidine kinase